MSGIMLYGRLIEQTSVLCVPLFEIAEPLCEEFDGDVLVVVEQMSLRGLSGVVHERVRIGRNARYTRYDVSIHSHLT